MKKRRERGLLDLPVVEVTWCDHTTWTGWRSRTDAAALTAAECRDVGRVISRTKDSLVLAGTVAADGDVNNVMLIPRPWVRRIRRLRS